ncbi:MAG TPA: PepSY-associated TM helix domain-containing protein, partial [Bryobacteraceae bacterium]|nr:PepSY-associated TM helix domain-containing protein [Bryobacteraceae bacterium]
MTFGQRWIRQPQTIWLRKAIFQIHLWSGIGFGLYVLMASVTGSVLVYSNELFRAATRDPIVVATPGPRLGTRLSDEQLKAAAMSAYPGYKAVTLSHERNPNQAVTISLKAGSRAKSRLFNPYTGADLGNSVPWGIWLVSRTMELHDDLLAGPTGREVNGTGALLLLLLGFSGIVVWWPGIKAWRRNLTAHRKTGWRRFIWELHGMIGFWSLGFLVVFGVSGAYLGDPQPFQDLADRIQPAT